jgi:hypothetical protein
MSSLGARTNQFLRFGIVVFGIAGCKTDLGPPEASAVKLSGQAPAAMSSPTQLTIYSRENGRSYTLDITARRLRYSTGDVLDLTADQTNGMIATFNSVITTDAVADSLGSLRYGDVTGCHPQCPTAYSVPKKGTQTLNGSSIQGTSSQTSLTSSTSTTGDLTLGFSQINITSSLFDPDVMLSDPCTDIVTAAAVAKLNYTSRRTRAFDEILSAAITEAGNLALKVLPEGTAAGALLNSNLLGIQTTSWQVKIMAFFWNSHSCSSRKLSTAPIYHIPAPGTIGTHWACAPVPNSYFSIDGGPWMSVELNICEWAE